MTTLKARFDGRVLVPETPVDLPQDRVLEIYIDESVALPGDGDAPETSPLLKLAQSLEGLPYDAASPTDGAEQHDHYLYGTAKRS